MPLEITKIQERVFKFKKNGTTVTLADPDPSLTAEEVLQAYSNQYPELTTATLEEPKVEDKTTVFNIKTTVGTKG